MEKIRIVSDRKFSVTTEWNIWNVKGRWVERRTRRSASDDDSSSLVYIQKIHQAQRGNQLRLSTCSNSADFHISPSPLVLDESLIRVSIITLTDKSEIFKQCKIMNEEEKF